MNHRQNSHLFSAICKYGAENFKIESLVEVESKQEMDYYEKALIKIWDLQNSEKGYNLTEGGGGMLGFKLSEETKLKMSQHVKSEEHRKRISIAKMDNKSRTGMKDTEASIQKRANSLRGKKLSPAHIRSLRIGSHNRRHTKKGVLDLNCEFCKESNDQSASRTR
jgi:group I intron endonuclease